MKDAVKTHLSQSFEVWVTADELCQQLPAITPKFLRQHGDIFPRRRITIVDTDGKRHSSRWAYARNEIINNFSNGVYDEIKVLN